MVRPQAQFGSVMEERRALARVIVKAHKEFFDPRFLEASGIRRDLEEEHSYSQAHGVLTSRVSDEDVREALAERILALGDRLRRAWSDQDPRNKQWQAFIIRLLYHKTRGGEQYSAPDRTPFDIALEYFQANWDKTRVCRRIDCPNSRYFFRGDKDKGYCSTECSVEGTKAVRLRSYYKNKKTAPGGGGKRHGKK